MVYIIIGSVLLILNIISFSLMGHDKKLAKKAASDPSVMRVRERTLFLWCALFGGLGGVLGMRVFRHKTKHWYFAVFFPLMLIAQLVFLGFCAHWAGLF